MNFGLNIIYRFIYRKDIRVILTYSVRLKDMGCLFGMARLKKKYFRIRKIAALNGYQFDRHDRYLNLRSVLIFSIYVM